MSKTNDLNQAVRSYIALLAVVAIAALALSGLTGSTASDGGQLVLAAALASGILAAQYFPVHLTDKTKVYVDTTILVAAVLLLPPWLAIVIAGATAAVHELTLRVSWEQGIFNIAQSMIYVAAGAWIFHALDGAGTSPPLTEAKVLVAALAGVVAMHLLNTLAVAVVGALQLGRPPLEFWLESIWFDLPEHIVLVANGLLLAFAASAYPWLLPLIAGPLVLVYLSLRRSAELRETTRAMLEAISDLNELLGRDTRAGTVRHERPDGGSGRGKPGGELPRARRGVPSTPKLNGGMVASIAAVVRRAGSGTTGFTSSVPAIVTVPGRALAPDRIRRS